eukprot:TRINITY_DN1556_c0_g1_i2.p2 TRINITY_DN1556_c0_g1~~TRINITY_DN1556_c0_g1_i2.p2  ORF type:complete len:161 (+),score=55.27 TRINITY_DN1556_c0_g1_i2:50-532(+)
MAEPSDLTKYVDVSKSCCLNEDTQHPFANIFADDESYLMSDADEQLLLCLQFQQNVKVHTLRVAATSADERPSSFKIFVNKSSMSFGDAESSVCTQQVQVPEGGGEVDIPLKYVKFQNVVSLTIFIEGNHGGEDTTRLDRLIILGSLVHTTNMNELKKVG